MELMSLCESTFLKLKADDKIGDRRNIKGSVDDVDAVAGANQHKNLTEDDKLRLIKSYTLVPDFIPPYPLCSHPMVAEAYKVTHKWLLDHPNIHKSCPPEKFEIKELYCVALASASYPEATWKGLQLASKLTTLLIWFVDDVMDDVTEIAKGWNMALSFVKEIHLVMMSTFPDDRTLLKCWMEFVDRFASERRKDIQNLVNDERFSDAINKRESKIYSGELSPLASAFRELWGEVVAEATNVESSLRLAQLFQKYLVTSLIQMQNKNDDVILSLDDYMLLRREANLVVFFLVLVDWTDDIFLPNEILCIPQMKRIIDITNDVLSWHNDVFSFRKEYLQGGDKHNLVFLISHHLACSFDVAASIINEMLYARCSEMDELAKVVVTLTPPEHQHALSRYLATSRNMISASDDWHRGTLRYKLQL